MPETLSVGSLCTGYGGLDLAVERHFGARTVWVSDLEPAACQILEARFPGVPNLGDLTTIDWATVAPVDILTAGYPCQPFSHAGKRKGANDVRHLWPYIAHAVGVLRPRWCIFENVQGHLTLGGMEVVDSLAAMGYSVRWGLVRASDAGAPHRRARLFIVAHDADASSGPQPRAAVEGNGLRIPGEHGCIAPADARGFGLDGGQDLSGDGGHPAIRGEAGSDPSDGHTSWGAYTAAVERWGGVLGRPAPVPAITDGRGVTRLNPEMVEWMMGLPAGWVTGLGLPRTAQLKALGNGVVPQQALLALSLLVDET